MKGIMLAEFLDHAAGRLGPSGVETMVDRCPLGSGGAYSRSGTYPSSEMTELVGALSEATGESHDSILRGFGHRLGATFVEAYPEYFDAACFFDFVESIDSHIHVEVMKRYPEAKLPRFRTVWRSEDALIIDYISPRRLEGLAHGLLEACAKPFGEVVHIQTSIIKTDEASTVRFRLEKR